MSSHTERSTWKNLYRMGGVAPLITLALYVSEFFAIIVSGVAYPVTPAEWFALFQRDKILGLLFLNAPDVLSIALLGIMFLALVMALKRDNPSAMVIAAFVAFLGIALFVSTRADMVTAILSLSEQYAAATTDAQRAQLLAAGQAIHAPIRATPETTGFFFIAVAGLIVSVVILRSDTFNKITAYVGILGGLSTMANHASLLIAPSLAAILMPVSGLLWLVWWVMMSVGLFKLGRDVPDARNQSTIFS
ncbi:MAG: DUF4386 family protein [Anaerolineae bacterium]|nr:DUF4386 family protein [Anaerolineae bacterium]